ncbi:MAG: hypothetical protein WC393_01970 [Candidatus Nanoarchaeia archaeon]|jgi:hypothetical protein
MATHKLQKSGRSFYVYVPTKWVNDNCLKKGNELNVAINSEGVLIKNIKNKKNIKKISLKIKTSNPKVISNAIMNLFVIGYDEFELILDKKIEKNDYKKLKEFIVLFGLNIVDLTDKIIKLYTNVEINDLKRYVKEYLYKSLNVSRMLLENTSKELLEEQYSSFYYFRFLVQRTINRHNLGLINLDFNNFWAHYYENVALCLSKIINYMIQIKDKKFIEKCKFLFEKLLIQYSELNFEKINDLFSFVEALSNNNVENYQDYYKRRIYKHFMLILKEFNKVSILVRDN